MSERSKVIDSPRTLVEGQRLDQPTFLALYEAMPLGNRAELIDGVVYMPSPVGLAHGVVQVPVILWLDYYAEKTPAVQVTDNATKILGWKREPQPDGLPRILPERGGRTWNEGWFVTVLRNSSSRSPMRLGTSTSGRSWPSTSIPGFWSTSYT
jgi:hypothetical protein